MRYCTPGMTLGAVALLEKNAHPTNEEIAAWMNGPICRCARSPRTSRGIRRTYGPDLPSVGAGETPITALAPAIGNAVFDATGVRIRAMPIQGQALREA